MDDRVEGVPSLQELFVDRPAREWLAKVEAVTAAGEVVIAAAQKEIAALRAQLAAQATAVAELRANYMQLATVRHVDVQHDEDGVAIGYVESRDVVWPGRDFDAEFAALVQRAEEAVGHE